jgi:hypothetical protein
MVTRSVRIDTLKVALDLARAQTDDFSQVTRLNQALHDVALHTVLPRTEAALAEARGLISARSRP